MNKDKALKLALEEYDAGLLSNYGGGNVEWWQDYIRAELGRAYEHYQSQTTPPLPVQEQHSDDVAVDKFAAAMKAKLADARSKGRGGWESCPPASLSQMLRQHVDKGDPRDVANFCMMLWNLDTGIATLPVQPVQEPDLTAVYMSGLYDGKKQRPWVGLTDDEKETLAYDAEGNTWTAIELAERKLKEKNI
jgi:hypothetical protein